MATTESLILELDAKIDGYVSKMNEAEGTTTTKTNKMAEGIKGVATTFLAATAGAAVLVKELAANAKELNNNAQMARLSVERFQELANAYKTVGIDADKFSDISKDVTDRVGDFLQTGGGPLADFFENVAPKIGLTAKELQGLSGHDALQAVKNAMDEVNLSAEEQVFHFEAIAGDASKLIPLMANQGEGIKKLNKNFKDFNTTLSATDVNNLTALDKLFEDMGDSITKDLSKSVSAFSDEIADMVITADALFKVLGASLIGNITNGVREAEIMLHTLGGVWHQVFGNDEAVDASIAELARLEALDAALDASADAEIVRILEQRDARKKAHDEHIAQLGETRDNQLNNIAPVEEDPEVAAARAKQEALREIDAEAAVAEVEASAKARREADMKLSDEATDAKWRKKWADEEINAEKNKLKAKKNYVSAAAVLNAAFFNNNKAIGAGIIVANTAIAVTESMKTMGGMPLAAPAVALDLAVGAAQLKNLSSAGKGGGSIGGGGGGGGVSTVIGPATSEIEISSGIADAGEGATAGGGTIRFDTESGDDFIDAMAGKFNEGLANGRIILSEGS